MSLFGRKNSQSSEQVPKIQDDSLNELRKLLVGPLQSQFDEIQELLNNQSLNPDEISKILPEAIMLRSSRDEQITKALEPITEEAIKASIQRDPRVLVDVFVPVMLPAIKKAITTLIKEMIQSFSATLEHGLSMRGLKWRFEAFKTKKPFGEIALLHSLVYQVEQVFLIHKESGLVLQHVVAEETTAQDPDMVSAMLSAIQDFVRDSFGGSQDDALENLQFGDRSVLIEQSSLAVLAAVVRGNAPVELQSILQDTLNSIHFGQMDNLKHFDGDTEPFEPSKVRLSDCLKSQVNVKEHNPYISWVIIGLIMISIGYGSFIFIRDHIRWKDYLEKLHHEPGIVITETEKKSSEYYIFGLRDPLSTDPEAILKQTPIKLERVHFDWELYHSSHPGFILKRIESILHPPETIRFEFKDGILHAEGSAPRQWILDSKKLVETIPGILGFQNDKVVAMEQQRIEHIEKMVENIFFFFDMVSVKVKPEQQNIIDDIAEKIKESIQLAQMFDQKIHIEIIGHTDSVGSDERNLKISELRAQEIFSHLVSQGIPPEILSTKGLGASEPIRKELLEEDRKFNRCVNFKVRILEKDEVIEPASESSAQEESNTEEAIQNTEVTEADSG